MKFDTPVVILAGGFGTRLSEETDKRPKPMVRIGEKPILWHLMSIYAAQGFNRFLIATGYMHEVIDEWVTNNNRNLEWGFECEAESVFTGHSTQTGGRIRRIIEKFNHDRYMLTYGDGLANVNLNSLYEFHMQHGRTATVTSVRPPARFGVVTSKDGLVTHFGEKKQTQSGWINGGFFVVEKKILGYLSDDFMPFEQKPLSDLVKLKELMTFKHKDYWQPMDTLREKTILTEEAAKHNPPWMNFLQG